MPETLNRSLCGIGPGKLGLLYLAYREQPGRFGWLAGVFVGAVLVPVSCRFAYDARARNLPGGRGTTADDRASSPRATTPDEPRESPSRALQTSATGALRICGSTPPLLAPAAAGTPAAIRTSHDAPSARFGTQNAFFERSLAGPKPSFIFSTQAVEPCRLSDRQPGGFITLLGNHTSVLVRPDRPTQRPWIKE